MPKAHYRQAHFLTSAAKLKQCPPDTGLEVAFAGRSNAGKSSALNCICDQKALAKTSKTPGRTQLINFFSFCENKYLVDLPGYGYAKVSESVKKNWQATLGDYLRERDSLKGLILLMDSRHPLKPLDEMILHWAIECELPTHILLTKADKLSKNEAQKALKKVKETYTLAEDLVSVQVFSALKKQGLDKVYQVLDEWFELV